jgi:cysteine desulfurase / selenocysteine lyase
LQVGLGVAVEQCLELGVEAIEARILHLADLMRRGLERLPGVAVWDRGKRLCGIVSFTKVGPILVDIASATRE